MLGRLAGEVVQHPELLRERPVGTEGNKPEKN
jgi:hypothetical protein